MRRLRVLVFSLAVLALTSCSKDDDFVNLTSTLSMENNLVGTTEGGYVYVNLNLSDALSENLRLKTEISTQGITGHIDPEDYDSKIQYSTNSKVWKDIDAKGEMLLEKETTTLKVRLKTIDDKLPEVVEEFNLKITPAGADKLTLTNNLSDIKVSVLDNDVSMRPTEEGVVMGFDIKPDYSGYTIISVSERASSTFEKEVIDEKYKKVMEDALKAYKLLPDGVKVSRLLLVANPNSGLGGYVFNAPTEDDPDNWTMGMNVGFAYFNAADDYKPMPYNDNGVYGNIFTHELGHIFTLNNKEQVDLKPMPEDGCSTYTVQGSCSHADSHVNQFNENFYKTPVTNLPAHVSAYAASSLEEDIAESIAHYATQNNIPASTSASSGALQKINFVKGRSQFTNFKTEIRDIFKLNYAPGNADILAKQVDKNGKRISCLDYKAIKALLKSEKENK